MMYTKRNLRIGDASPGASRPGRRSEAMDLQKTIEALHAEKERIERVLAMLEELNGTLPIRRYSTGRRGRKSMPPEERALVSVRMKKYWARRRNDKITS